MSRVDYELHYSLGSLAFSMALCGVAVAVARRGGGAGIQYVRSLTPSEMHQIILDKFTDFCGEYLMCRKWIQDPSWASGRGRARDVVVRVAERYYRDVEKHPEDEARSRAESEVSRLERASAAHRLSFVEQISEVVKPPPSMLFIGPPGVGKSESVYRAARNLAREYDLEFLDYRGLEDLERIRADPLRYFVYIDLRLTSVEPADLTGIPRSVEVGGRTISEYIPFGWAEALSLAPGVLNLEELTNVQRKDVLSAAYQVILDRRAGFTKFNKGVFIVALGNPPEWSAVATALPIPLLNRLEAFNVAPPTVDEWIEYMDRVYGRDGWLRIIGIFLKNHPSLLLPPEAQKRSGLKPEDQIPTPRSWTRLAVQLRRLLKDEPKPDIKFAEILASVANPAEAIEKRPGEPGYSWEAKRILEVIRANVGDHAMRRVHSILAFKIEIGPDKAIEEPDKFIEWFERVAKEKASATGEPERDVKRTLAVIYTTMISDYINRLVEEKGAEKVEAELLEKAGNLAKLADFFGKIDRPLMANMLMPACTYKMFKLKVKLYELSSEIRRHCEEYAEQLMAGAG